jgi:Mg-chelatase subunit ChlD/capsular polysaccharide biosynthesis protein
MNDETPEPFDTVGDAPVEARIVAWVLGEASAFEAAELERLCEEKPELLVFRRRMRALHGLLTAVEASEADHSWKLPPDKLKRLDEIFGDEEPVRLEPVNERRIRRSGMRTFMAIAACLVLSLVVFKLTHPSYVSEAVIEVRSRTGGMNLGFGQTGKPKSDQMIPQFFGTEFNKIKSTESLGKVVEELALDEQWKVSKPEAIAKLKKNVETENLKGTDLIAIRVKESTQADADRITRALVSSYKDYRAEIEKRDASKELFELNKAVRDQEDKVEERRKVLATIVRTKGIIYKGQDSFYGQSGMDEDPGAGAIKHKVKDEAIGRGLDAQDYVDAKRVFEADQQLLQTMRLAQINKTIQGKMGEDSVVIHEMPPADTSLAAAERSLRTVLSAPAAPPVASASKPAEGAAVGYAMSLAKEKNGLHDESRDSPRSRLAGELKAEAPVAAMAAASAEPEVAQSSAITAMPTLNGSGLAGGLGGGLESSLGKSMDETAESADKDLLTASDSFVNSEVGSASANNMDGFAGRSDVDFISPAADMPSLSSRAPRGPSRPAPARRLSKLAQREIISRPSMIENKAKKIDAIEVPADQAITGKKAEAKVISEFGKQPLLVETMDEVSASGDPYSTFSLNISDASFQLAKVALAKGERPDPESIKLEQFYNAVDYGDPGPSANEPVAASIGQSAHPVIPGRNLVRVALRTASVGHAASQPLRLTLLVDQSGSMVREDRRAAMAKALLQLGGLLTENDVVSIVGFSRTPRLLADRLSGSDGAKLENVINQAASEGGTNLEEALKLGAMIAERQQLVGAQNRIVLFTDGAANLGDADPDRLAELVTALRQKGIAFDIAGIGADGLNDNLLGNLARHGNGRYYVVGDDDRFARQLAGAFSPAAENVKVQVILNPLRVGKYKLLGFEKDRLKTEDFRNDAVDAAELAADEAGVALYQVETLPDGKGEIGEVSVRFRDTASGEMVERSWTIPYEVSALAFDRATPSMQLAGLSLLAGEKLRGGAMAGAIDFKQFAKPLAEVRRIYQSSARVGEMLQVIDAVK